MHWIHNIQCISLHEPVRLWQTVSACDHWSESFSARLAVNCYLFWYAWSAHTSLGSHRHSVQSKSASPRTCFISLFNSVLNHCSSRLVKCIFSWKNMKKDQLVSSQLDTVCTDVLQLCSVISAQWWMQRSQHTHLINYAHANTDSSVPVTNRLQELSK